MAGLNELIIFTVANIIIVGIIIWITSYYLYFISTEYLAKTSKILKEFTDIILHIIEEVKLINYNQENKGNPIGIDFYRYLTDKTSIKDKSE